MFEKKTDVIEQGEQIKFDFDEKKVYNSDLIEEIKEINIDNLTPLNALNYLSTLKEKLGGNKNVK